LYNAFYKNKLKCKIEKTFSILFR